MQRALDLKVVPGALDLKASEDWRIKEVVCNPRSDVPFHEFWLAVGGRIVENARGDAVDPAAVLDRNTIRGETRSSNN